MPNIDFLKEKSDRLKIMLRVLLNAILALFLGLSGLVYSLFVGAIKTGVFWALSILLLLILIKLVIISIALWKNLDKIFAQIKKEK
jgi:membrane protein YdbS with pleckstrin-like domain